MTELRLSDNDGDEGPAGNGQSGSKIYYEKLCFDGRTHVLSHWLQMRTVRTARHDAAPVTSVHGQRASAAFPALSSRWSKSHLLHEVRFIFAARISAVPVKPYRTHGIEPAMPKLCAHAWNRHASEAHQGIR